MPKKFDIPAYYRSPIIGAIKSARRARDAMKRDLSPTWLNLGVVRLGVARHFGFCFGVENAIDIAYRAVAEAEGRRVFLLSEMIHNEQVNADLRARGVEFLMTPAGEELVSFSSLTADDVVIVPAFGTTREILERLTAQGVSPHLYDATCPFVEKVWNRSEQLGRQGYTIVIHGKSFHEETRATFSHAVPHAPAVIVRDMEEATVLARAIRGELSQAQFEELFQAKYSVGFQVARDLARIGVVNQTTMLASETTEIASMLREVMLRQFGGESLAHHFADTRDTLCYATNENQDATHALVREQADLAIVVGGYNSSNTSQLVKICEKHLPTYHVKGPEELVSIEEIRSFYLKEKGVRTQKGWLPDRHPITILITAGASCPDAVVDAVIGRIAGFFAVQERVEQAVREAIAVPG